ncbi:YcaO-like family protein [Clostridium algidicarnis]|uniref:YcaO-like family protein n=1 Tax=Clostridium algidicarnis TaxID=37659 RepID=UPI001C0DDA44|nr:YcaO-like family protein [Clostridium algidicarnis]MBU3228912.1 YcaO-like family protein [Clostridium algidicarnis]MBU3252456.1 YcaO-like family protein [Clostridium algidicarnis]
MLFCYFGQRYKILKQSYLPNYKIGFGVFGTVKAENKLSPCTPSAIDLSKYDLYKKVYQEYLERFRIAHNTNSYYKVKCFDALNQKISINNRNVLGYGLNDEYGVMDTTGTASGFNSEKLKEKALLELIEKNEVMLIWYLEKGYNVSIDKVVRRLINSIGFHSQDIYIFCSNNLCNLTTFSIFLFNNKEIVATGVSIDKDSEKALSKALLEAKLLEAFYRDSDISPYKLFSNHQYKTIYEFVKNLSYTLESICIEKDVKKDIILAPWITSIEFAILNTKCYQDYITIRCFSKELLNCIPNQDNIFQSLDKKIFKSYNLSEADILRKPPCIIL